MTDPAAGPTSSAAAAADPRGALRARIEALLADAGWGPLPGSAVQRGLPVPAAAGQPAARADYLLLLDGVALALIACWDDPQRPARDGAPAAMALAQRLGLRVAFVCSTDTLLFVAGGGHELAEFGHLPAPADLAPIARYGTRYLAGPPDAPSPPPQPAAPLPPPAQASAAPPPGALLASAARAVDAVWRALHSRGRPKMAEPPDAAPPPAAEAAPPPTAPDAGPGTAGAEPPASDADAAAAALAGPEPPSAEPVLLAASAPRECRAGDGFSASVAAYVAAARDAALAQLQQLGEAGDRVVSDLAPLGDACWAVGAPVSVRLSGQGVTVSPPAQHFRWNGRCNTVSFDVQVDADAPAGRLALWCHVALAGVTMLEIPLRVAVLAGGPAPVAGAVATAATDGLPSPRSAFASYSSKDASLVTQRLSTLVRWAPGLDIFQDCLDLQPNAAFQPQLAEQIRRRDVFLLFWSRHAAASPWVGWELDTARQAKPPQAIVPMPLEDPAIAPPPPGLETLHLRDRFLLADYGLQRIRDEAAAARPDGRG